MEDRCWLQVLTMKYMRTTPGSGQWLISPAEETRSGMSKRQKTTLKIKSRDSTGCGPATRRHALRFRRAVPASRRRVAFVMVGSDSYLRLGRRA